MYRDGTVMISDHWSDLYHIPIAFVLSFNLIAHWPAFKNYRGGGGSHLSLLFSKIVYIFPTTHRIFVALKKNGFSRSKY